MSGIGQHIASRRRALGLTQDELADRLCIASGAATFTRHEVSRYERGARTPVGATLRWLAAALDTSVGELVDAAARDQGDAGVERPVDALAALLAGDVPDASAVAYRWQTTVPPQIVAVRAGRHVGAALADEVTARTRDLRLLDDHLGGRDLAALVGRELALTITLARDASYAPAVGRRLLAAIADLAQVAGWTASDAGHTEPAGRYYAAGIAAAHAAGDAGLAASALSSWAYQTATAPGGDRHPGLLMAAAAVRGARQMTGAGRAIVVDRLAWAHARTGDVAGTDAALDLADDAFGEVATAATPAWAYWISRDEIDVMRGRCAVQLARPGPAIAALSAAIGRYPVDHTRELSLYRSYLAEAYLLAGDRDQAAALTAGLVDAGSDRVDDRVDHLSGLLADGGPDTP